MTCSTVIDEILGKRKLKVSGKKQTVLRYGVGIMDAPFRTQWVENGKNVHDKAYTAWHCMLQRCYSKGFLDKHPTYMGCCVCEEWLTFSCFDKWFLENYVDGFQLDKDILVSGNKIYSPDTCLFVPGWVNKFIADSGATRGEYPIGVCKFAGNKIKARCRQPNKKSYHLGVFKTVEDAYDAWLRAKLEVLEFYKQSLDEIDNRLYSCLKAKILSLK